MAEHETLFGSKPSPSKSGKRASRCSNVVPSIRKFSVGGAMLQDPKPERSALVLKSKNKKGSLPIHNSSILGKKNAAGHATQSTGNLIVLIEKLVYHLLFECLKGSVLHSLHLFIISIIQMRL